MIPFTKHILFPTDFSDHARHTLPFAVEIARRTGSTLHLFHSIEEPYDFAPMIDEIIKGVTGRVRELFREMTDEIKADPKNRDLEIRTHIQSGRAAHSILEEAEIRNAGLIVMGNRGRTGLEKLFIGSTTAEVIRRSEIPVLAVPSHSVLSEFKQILFTTEYHDGDLEALEVVTEFAGYFDATVRIFHASLENDLKTEAMFRGFRELVVEKINYPGLEFSLDTSITLHEAVADKIEEGDLSMIVMVRYEKPFGLLRKSQSKDMSYYVQVPLMVIPGNVQEEIYDEA